MCPDGAHYRHTTADGRPRGGPIGVKWWMRRVVTRTALPRALRDLLLVLHDDPMLFLDHVLRRGPRRQGDGAQALAGGGLRDVDRDFNDPGRLHCHRAGAAHQGKVQVG